jgi:hypothetical protein
MSLTTYTTAFRRIVDSRIVGAREHLRHLTDPDAATTRRVDLVRRLLLRSGTLAGLRALAMRNKERVEQGAHRCLFVGSEQFRGFEGQFQTRVATKTTGAKDQFVAGRRKSRRQLAQHTKGRFGLTRFIEADLVREHIQRLCERRLGESTFAAQRRQILGKSHAPLYRLCAARWYVILILSVGL